MYRKDKRRVRAERCCPMFTETANQLSGNGFVVELRSENYFPSRSATRSSSHAVRYRDDVTYRDRRYRFGKIGSSIEHELVRGISRRGGADSPNFVALYATTESSDARCRSRDGFDMHDSVWRLPRDRNSFCPFTYRACCFRHRAFGYHK